MLKEKKEQKQIDLITQLLTEIVKRMDSQALIIRALNLTVNALMEKVNNLEQDKLLEDDSGDSTRGN
ncbi:MAG: hypothetical protein WC476_00940 [Phycisphaerae bacterium]|jgi:hypothetical protein